MGINPISTEAGGCCSGPLATLERTEAHENANGCDGQKVENGGRVDETPRERLIAGLKGKKLDRVAETAGNERSHPADGVKNAQGRRRHEERDDVALREAAQHHSDSDGGRGKEDAP